MVDSAKLRGWKYDHVNGYMEAWDSGTAVARFDGTDGFTLLIDSLDLHGQTITTVTTATGASTVLDTWVATFNAASGSDDETPKYAVCIKVGGTAYYMPAFTSIS